MNAKALLQHMLHLAKGAMRCVSCVRLGRGQCRLAAQRAHASAHGNGTSGRFNGSLKLRRYQAMGCSYSFHKCPGGSL